ncbi:MAG: hypothetical protein H6611_00725 [Ignavibacteriales bacterium]|nr:hypothetical protein [Ignavibacteriales bacterium]
MNKNFKLIFGANNKLQSVFVILLFGISEIRSIDNLRQLSIFVSSREPTYLSAYI